MKAPKKFNKTIPLNAVGSVLIVLFFLVLAVALGTVLGIVIVFLELFQTDSSLFTLLDNPDSFSTAHLESLLEKYTVFFTWINLPLFAFTIYIGLKVFDGITFNDVFSYRKSSSQVFFFSTLAAISLVFAISPYFPEPNKSEIDLVSVITGSWVGILAIVVMAPITEEYFFRAFLIKGLIKYHSPWVAILISSFLFGAIHMNVWQSLPAFFLGIYFGYIFVITKDTLLVIVMHAVVNMLGVIPFLFSDNYSIQDTHQYESGSGIFGLVIFFCSLIFVIRDRDVITNLSSIYTKDL